eukprot:m.388600 g.388600  ORF g.388600 m.388600 type:complete len:340 (-) comp56326_c0_seq4:31-1050(-)
MKFKKRTACHHLDLRRRRCFWHACPRALIQPLMFEHRLLLPLACELLIISCRMSSQTVGSESRQTPAASEMQDEWREPTGNRLGLHDLLTASHSPNNSTRRAARREEGVDQQLGQRHPSPCRTPGSPNAAAARAFLHTHEHAQPPGSLVRSSDSSTSTPSTESPQRSTASDLVPSLSQDESPRMRSTGSPLPFFRSHLATIEPVSLHAVEESRSRGTASPVPRSPLALLKSQVSRCSSSLFLWLDSSSFLRSLASPHSRYHCVRTGRPIRPPSKLQVWRSPRAIASSRVKRLLAGRELQPGSGRLPLDLTELRIIPYLVVPFFVCSTTSCETSVVGAAC